MKYIVIPIQICLAIILMLISFFFIKDQLIKLFPEINIDYVNYFSLILVIIIETTIILSLYFGVDYLFINQKKALVLLSICIPLFSLNFVFFSKGSQILVNNNIDKSIQINTFFSDSLNNTLSNIDIKINQYEDIIFRNDTTKINWLNSKTIKNNIELASFQIKELQSQKKQIKEEIIKQKDIELQKNMIDVSEKSKQYYYFSIAMILITIFFNSISAILSNIFKKDKCSSKNGTQDKNDCTVSVQQTLHKENSENNKKILELQNEVDSLQNKLIEQKNDFVLLINMRNDLEAIKRMTKDKQIEATNLILDKYLALKKKLGVNGNMDDRYTFINGTVSVHAKNTTVH